MTQKKQTAGRIQKQIDLLRVQLDALSIQEFHECTRNASMVLIGKYFVYRNNSYSCPDPGQYWSEYRQILAIVRGKDCAHIVYREFSVDYRGHATAFVDCVCTWNKDFVRTPFTSSWVKCDPKEAESASDSVRDQIYESPSQLIAYTESELA